jgi:hypothetical protein
VVAGGAGPNAEARAGEGLVRRVMVQPMTMGFRSIRLHLIPLTFRLTNTARQATVGRTSFRALANRRAGYLRALFLFKALFWPFTHQELPAAAAGARIREPLFSKGSLPCLG